MSFLGFFLAARDWVDYGTLAVNALLLLVAAIAASYALGTLKAIKTQGRAAQNSERAWLVMRPDAFPLQPSRCLSWKIANVGRTTALVTETMVVCEAYSIGKMLAVFPDYTGKQPINYPNIPIAPNDVLKDWSNIAIGKAGVEGLTAQNIEGIRGGNVWLEAHGFVKYTDSFGSTHESRFCYKYDTAFNEFRIDLTVSPEYHRHT